MTVRDRMIVVVLALAAVLAAFWFAVLSPKRGEATRLDSEIVVQRDRLQTAQATAAEADKARARYHADYAAVVRLGKAVPADDEMPSLLHQLETAARGARIDFRAITRAGGGEAGAAGAAATPAPAATDSAGTTSSGSTASGSAPAGTSSAQAAGTAPSAAASAALPPGASVGTAGLATLPFTFTFRGSYFKLESFLREVQGFVSSRNGSVSVRGRLLTVDGVALTPREGSFSQIDAKVSATAYLQPPGPEPAAGAAAGADASGAPAAPATSPPAQTASATSPGAS